MTAVRWALKYAELGWPVVPCHWIVGNGCSCRNPEHVIGDKAGKHPKTEHGFKDASTDPDTISRWWRQWPKANVAIATGPRSGVLVLDVDGREGEVALSTLEREHGPLPETPQQWTGGGNGWQLFFSWPEGRAIKSKAGALGPQLDQRGIDGMAMVPPSRTLESYRWAADRSPWQLPLAAPPEWLVDLLDPPVVERGIVDHGNVVSFVRDRDDRYLLRAVEAELALVASAPKGRRNDQLNESAFSLFRFAAEGRLDPSAIAHGLEQMALHAGLTPSEIATTLKSAADKRGVVLR